MRQPELRTVRLQGAHGVSLVADELGTDAAPPVILMHGGGQTRHAWSRASLELARAGYHVLSLDLRGHGESDWAADGNYRLDAFVDDLHVITRTLPSPPALVGASLGGVVSLLAAGRRDAEMAKALILVDIAPRVEAKGVDHIRNFMGAHLQGFETLQDAADAVAAYAPHRLRPTDLSGLMKNLRKGEDGRLYWHWDPAFLARQSSSEPLSMQQSMEQAALQAKCPVLLVRGQQSDVVSPESVEHLRSMIPHAETADVHGAGHMVAGDKNDAFNSAVLEFLHRNHPAS